MEADKNLSADIRKARSGNNTIAISQASISLSTSLTEPCLHEKAGGEFSLHQSNFTSDGQHLAVPRVTSGGSRRRECPLPKKLPPFGHGPRDFWAKPKSCGYFSWAPPSIPPCGFAVLVIPGKKAGFVPTGAVCRSCTLHACLHQGSPLPEGKPERFSRF